MKVVPKLMRPLELVRSDKGSLHCLQASMMMAVRSLLGVELSWHDAERLTGYLPGRDTWPYALCLSLSDLGLEVHSIEMFDPAGMATDPAKEVRSVFGPGDLAESVIGDMDLDYESRLAERCLQDPRISFEVRAPLASDVVEAVTRHELPLVSLDYGQLHHTGRYEGHMVVISGVSGDDVELYDPGPPGDAGLLVTVETLNRAMHSPTEESGAVILLKRSDAG